MFIGFDYFIHPQSLQSSLLEHKRQHHLADFFRTVRSSATGHRSQGGQAAIGEGRGGGGERKGISGQLFLLKKLYQTWVKVKTQKSLPENALSALQAVN